MKFGFVGVSAFVRRKPGLRLVFRVASLDYDHHHGTRIRAALLSIKSIGYNRPALHLQLPTRWRTCSSRKLPSLCRRPTHPSCRHTAPATAGDHCASHCHPSEILHWIRGRKLQDQCCQGAAAILQSEAE